MSIWTGAIGGGCLFSRRPGGSGLGIVCSGSGGGGDGGGGGGGGDGGGGLKSCRGEPSPVNSANVVGVKMVSIRNNTTIFLFIINLPILFMIQSTKTPLLYYLCSFS